MIRLKKATYLKIALFLLLAACFTHSASAEDRTPAIFADHMLRGEPVTIFGDGEQTRDFVFVDDVVDAFVRAATRGGGLVCNIGTGRETSVNEVLDTMARQSGVEVTRVTAPARPGELQRSSLDIERAGIQLGWRPWTDLADGTRAVLEFVAAGLG